MAAVEIVLFMATSPALFSHRRLFIHLPELGLKTFWGNELKAHVIMGAMKRWSPEQGSASTDMVPGGLEVA